MITDSENLEYRDVVTDTTAFFGMDSPLRKAEEHGGRKYEDRPQQREMSIQVAESLAESMNLCIEAPCGVGKSIAYLVPAILYSLKTKKPVIVSTETINLQEQLINKDIPLIKKLLDREFTACIAKGRSNYLCKRRLELVEHNDSVYLPSESMISEINRILTWVKITKDGAKSDLGFEPSAYTWQSVCCEAINCNGDKCKYFKNCFYFNSSRSLSSANVIITNHALLFSDLKMRMAVGSRLFPDYSAVIIDEAHQLENTAAKQLGTELSENSIYDMLRRLFNPDSSRGLLICKGKEVQLIKNIIVPTFDLTKAFFNAARRFIGNTDDSTKRIREPNFVEDTITAKLKLLETKLSEYIKLQVKEEFKTELNAQLIRCNEYRQTLTESFAAPTDETVCWVEIVKKTNKESVAINSAPLNIAELLKKHLFSKGIPVVLTSATLSVGKDLSYYKKRVGFTGNEKILSSPFNYAKQVKVYVTEGISAPSEEAYESDLAKYIKKYIELTNGKAFVLFTSYSMLTRIKTLTKGFFEEKGITLLVHGEGMPRSQMIEVFKEDINSVIFGVASFWTGVDIPGEALSNVIIPKLPFQVPTDPIVEARCDRIQKEGGDSFRDYILPEAILKFKQGIGRLIRNKTDKGIIVILDKRVLTKKYGEAFLDAIPDCPRIMG